jgi:hypothetical protein
VRRKKRESKEREKGGSGKEQAGVHGHQQRGSESIQWTDMMVIVAGVRPRLLQ